MRGHHSGKGELSKGFFGPPTPAGAGYGGAREESERQEARSTKHPPPPEAGYRAASVPSLKDAVPPTRMLRRGEGSGKAGENPIRLRRAGTEE